MDKNMDTELIVNEAQPEPTSHSGTFAYQRWGLLRAIDMVVLVLTLVLTMTVNRWISSNIVVTVVAFVVILVVLAIIATPLTEKFCQKQGSYEITPEKITFHLNKTITLDRQQVTFATCSRVKAKQGYPDTWCIHLKTRGMRGDILKLYSVTKDEHKKEAVGQIEEFLDMAKLFCQIDTEKK
jgi:hypothetical protein